MGLAPEIRFVEINLTEAEAFELEVQRILFWKSAGIVLTNKTNGGDGTSGLIWSEESRKVRSELSKKFMAERPNIRAKISATLKGRRLSDEALQNYLKAMRARVGVKRGPMANATKEKLRAAKTGQTLSAEAKAKIAAAHRGSKRTDETRAKMSESAKRVQGESRTRYCKTEDGRQQMTAMSRAAASDPRVRELRAEKMRAQWRDPAFRAKTIAAIKARFVKTNAEVE